MLVHLHYLSISYVSRESSRPSVGMSVRLTSITFPSWMNFHLCKVFCDLKVIVLKSYLKWWKVNSDKTEFRFKGKNKILKLILQYRLWHMLNHWMLSGKFEGSEIPHGIFWGSIFCPGNFWVLLEALRPPPFLFDHPLTWNPEYPLWSLGKISGSSILNKDP